MASSSPSISSSFLSAAKRRIQHEATKFLEIRVVLSKLERQGLLEHMLGLSYTLISASVQQIKQELTRMPLCNSSFDQSSLEAIYRENLKLISSLLIDEVWHNFHSHKDYHAAQQFPAQSVELPPLDTHDPHQPTSCFQCSQLFPSCGRVQEEGELDEEADDQILDEVLPCQPSLGDTHDAIPFNSIGMTTSAHENSPSLAPPQSLEHTALILNQREEPISEKADIHLPEILSQPLSPELAADSISETISEAMEGLVLQTGGGGIGDGGGGKKKQREDATLESEHSTSPRRALSKSECVVPSSFFSLYQAKQEEVLSDPRARRQSTQVVTSKRQTFLEPDYSSSMQRRFSIDKLDTLQEENSQMPESSAGEGELYAAGTTTQRSVLEEHRPESYRKKIKATVTIPNRSFQDNRRKVWTYRELAEEQRRLKPRKTNGAGTFAKQPRRMNQQRKGAESPGPAAYEQEQRHRSPGGVIPRQTRATVLSVQPKEEFYPGPSDYEPSFDFISK